MNKTAPHIGISCVRCGRICQPGDSRNSEARPFRLAKAGLCENCVVTQFLLCADLEPVRIGLSRNGIEVLKNPAIQDQFAKILEEGNSELLTNRIDWNTVIDQWNLPFPKGYQP